MSSSPFDASYLFGNLIRNSPFLIVAVAGIALCMTRETRPVRVRVAVGCALAIEFMTHLVLPLIYSLYFMSTRSGGSSMGATSLGVMFIGLIGSSASAVALCLLLFAAFTHDDRVVEPVRS